VPNNTELHLIIAELL